MTTWPLPAELTIYHVAELHRDWLARLTAIDREPAEAAAACIDATALQQLDGAGLQLLLALRRALVERGIVVQLQGAGGVLQAAAAALGLSASLGLADATPGATA
jgi:ABC-type transporter Mla MlaB component